jgi:U3 small nucleolar RNA-associated protein 15
MNSRAILRTLDSHKQPVHVTKFSVLDQTQVLSCSDDNTVKLWDIPSQSPISTFTGHTDYVRSGQVSTSSPHLILTGSYDGTVRLFDSRSGDNELVLKAEGINSKSTTPVEQVLMFPSGTVALAAAGPILRVWDLIAGGRCIRALSNHQKTITSLAFDSNAGRLLTGSLDHMVKVYDVGTYRVVHTMRYPAPVLCLAVSVSVVTFLAWQHSLITSIARQHTRSSRNVRRNSFRPSSTTESFGKFCFRSTLFCRSASFRGL